VRELHDLPRFRKPPLGRPAFLSNSAELVSEPVALERKPATAQPVAAAQPEVTKPVLIQSVVIPTAPLGPPLRSGRQRPIFPEPLNLKSLLSQGSHAHPAPQPHSHPGPVC
jgi:hypothetical protein